MAAADVLIPPSDAARVDIVLVLVSYTNACVSSLPPVFDSPTIRYLNVLGPVETSVMPFAKLSDPPSVPRSRREKFGKKPSCMKAWDALFGSCAEPMTALPKYDPLAWLEKPPSVPRSCNPPATFPVNAWEPPF